MSPSTNAEDGRGVSELPQVLQPSQVQEAPKRLARHADDRPRPRQPGDDLEPGLRIIQVLHHLAADDELGGILAGIERLDRRRPEGHVELRRGRTPARLVDHRLGDVGAPSAQPASGQAKHQLPLAATHLVHVTRAGVDRQALELVAEPTDQPPLHRMARAVLVVDVATGGRRRGRHPGQPSTSPGYSTRTRSCRRSPFSAGPRPSARPDS